MTRTMYIIAEIGSNWRDKADILTSIRKASEAGATAAKLQMFSAEDLYGVTSHVNNLPLIREIPYTWLGTIRQQCDESKLDLIISTFHESKAKMVDNYVHYHKLASSELSNWQLQSYLLGTAQHKTIVSTGCSSEEEIRTVVQHFGNKLRALLYCVAAYPSKYIDLRNVRFLREMFPDVEVGLSDHSIDVAGVPLAAACDYEVQIIEKHVNFVGCTPEESPDAAHSLNEKEFADMTYLLRGKNKRSAARFHTTEEDDFSRLCRRKVVCIRDIKTGSRLILGQNCVLARPLVTWDGQALTPENMLDVMVSKCPIKVGDVISDNVAEVMRIV